MANKKKKPQIIQNEKYLLEIDTDKTIKLDPHDNDPLYVSTDLGAGMNDDPTQLTRTRIFYGDPSAEKLTKKMDAFSSQFMNAIGNSEAEMWKVVPKSDIKDILSRLLDHLEFRARLDWAKEQRYVFVDNHPPERVQNIIIGNSANSANAEASSFFKESIPIHE
jgi:hypothetical protein